jgi:Zn-dependent peptidase ImmA (M78 family)
MIPGTRKNLAIPEDEVPDIIDILNRREIRTRYGIKQLSLEIVPDGHLQGDEAQTLAIPGKVEIKIGKSIFEKAKMRDGHALMTLTHELGHAVLHEKPVPLARPIIETKRPEYLRAYESAEHQAKYFAAAFQMPRQIVLRFSSAEALARERHVSLMAATIRMAQCAPKTKRTIPPDTQRIIDEIKANSLRPSLRSVNERPIGNDALKLWDKAPCIPDEDPTEYRQAPSGFRIKKTEFNKVNAQGWFIENGRIHAALERHDCN